MYYVYILKGQVSGKFYIGYTDDLKRRLSEHNNRRNTSTKYDYWKLVYFEAYPTIISAKNREFKLKHHGKGLAEIKKRISL